MPIDRLLENASFGLAEAEAMAQAFAAICHPQIRMPDLRKLVARKVVNCAKPGTLN